MTAAGPEIRVATRGPRPRPNRPHPQPRDTSHHACADGTADFEPTAPLFTYRPMKGSRPEMPHPGPIFAWRGSLAHRAPSCSPQDPRTAVPRCGSRPRPRSSTRSRRPRLSADGLEAAQHRLLRGSSQSQGWTTIFPWTAHPTAARATQLARNVWQAASAPASWLYAFVVMEVGTRAVATATAATPRPSPPSSAPTASRSCRASAGAEDERSHRQVHTQRTGGVLGSDADLQRAATHGTSSPSTRGTTTPEGRTGPCSCAPLPTARRSSHSPHSGSNATTCSAD